MHSKGLKRLNIINIKETQNQNHHETPPDTHQGGYDKADGSCQEAAGRRWDHSPRAPPAGVHSGAAALEMAGRLLRRPRAGTTRPGHLQVQTQER